METLNWALIDIFIFSSFAAMIVDETVVYENLKGKAVLYYVLLFYLLFEWIFNRTVGKFITGTIVISTRTFGRPTFGQILSRTFLRIIPFEFVSFISKKPCGWHDSIPNTMVTTISERRRYQIERPKSYQK